MSIVLSSNGSILIKFFKQTLQNVGLQPVEFCQFFFEVLEGTSLFCWATDIPVWTSGDISSGFKSMTGQPYLP